MHVIEPSQFKKLPKKHKNRRYVVFLLVFCVAAAVTYGWLLYSRPLPPVNAQKVTIQIPATQSVSLPWPAYGQAAVAAQDYGLLANHGTQAAVPTASVAKLITALAVIKQKPLSLNQPGPTITLTSEDVNSYNDYISRNGSVVAVSDGEQISQYQALQALLLPSANNMADSLARWAFGSVDNYLKYANQMTASLGMNNTKVSDASGFSPDTKSTATDLVMLAQMILKEPVLMQIVGQKQATIPVDGVINNTNYLLGQDGVIGMKTGNTDEAGGCYVMAAQHTLASGKTVTVVTAVMGAPTLATAMNDSLALARASFVGFQPVTFLHKNQPIATYETAWGSNATAVAKEDVSTVVWAGQSTTVKVLLQDVSIPAKAGSQTAQAVLQTSGGQTTAGGYLNQPISEPSILWRIKRPAI